MMRFAPVLAALLMTGCDLLRSPGSPRADHHIGAVLPSERFVQRDAVTGAKMVVLTSGLQSDSKIYQTHPQWTADGQWVIFRSSGRAPGSQAYAVNERSGTIVQLTEGPGNDMGMLCIARKSMKLYYFRTVGADGKALATSRPAPGETAEHVIIELDLAKLLQDALSDHVRPAIAYERVCGKLGSGLRVAGGFGLDADERFAYIGVSGGDCGTHLPPGTEIEPTPPGQRMGAGPSGLRSMNLDTGEVKVILDTPFQMGHVQTNPWVPGEIIYCWETGGDAPQRMYTCLADGSHNRPLYVENSSDWVTHEVVVGRDEVMFNLIGHQSRLRKHPTGIAVINLRTDAMTIIGQVDEHHPAQPDANNLGVNAAGRDSYGGFWHSNGSPDGKWAAGDTFDGNVYLINRQSHAMSLLTTDHKMKPDHCHPTFKDDSSEILIQSGHWTNGTKLQLVILPVPKG